MCSHRLAIAKLVRDYKEPLFSHSPQISRQNKQELWEYIRQQAISQGAAQYARKSWKEIRDCVWAPIRRDTMAKVNKAKLVGEDTVLYTEVDKIVLEIIGTNGIDGLDEAKGGVDYFNDENMQAGFSAPDGQAPPLDAYADSGPMSNASGIEHLIGHNGMDGQIGNSASNSAGADGLNVHIVDIKPGPSLSQMLEMFSESSHQNVGQNSHQNGQQSTTGDVWQQMDEMVAEQQEQRMMNGKIGRTPPVLTPPQNQNLQQQNSLKRKPSSSQQIIPIANKFPKINQNSDAELDRAIKEAKLEQIHLQNQLLQEQIEEKRLQNELLQMEIAEKKMALKSKK